jgi:hypothetical protein
MCEVVQGCVKTRKLLIMSEKLQWLSETSEEFIEPAYVCSIGSIYACTCTVSEPVDNFICVICYEVQGSIIVSRMGPHASGRRPSIQLVAWMRRKLN